jgi:hypothetical protein
MAALLRKVYCAALDRIGADTADNRACGHSPMLQPPGQAGCLPRQYGSLSCHARAM